MDDPELLECPYDKSHMITPLRMPYHLLKCRKNFPTMDLAVCPFNATHEVHKAELRYHMMNCPSRAVLEKEIAYESMMRATNGVGGQTVNKGCTDLPPYRKLEIHDDQQEDWDAERNFNTFTAFPSRDRQQQRRINEREEVTLRRPVTEGKAARLAMAAEANSDIPQPAFNPSLLSLGRGRSRPTCPAVVKPGAATPALKPNIPSGLPPRPGLYSLAPTNLGNKSVPSLARGRGLLPPSTT